MALTPRDYQWEGAYYLTRRQGALLGFECGLGKTLTVLSALKLEPSMLPGSLIVCPPNLKKWWASQVEQELGVTATIYQGKRGKNYHDISQERGVVIAHYQHFQGAPKNPKPLARPLMSRRWNTVILDEAHWIKGRKAQRSKLLKHVRSERRWGLSGTLLGEAPQDLWSPLNWADKKNWPYYWPFVNNYCQVVERHMGHRSFKDIVGILPRKGGDGNYSTDITLKMLREATKDVVLFKTREDVGVQLPPVTTIDVDLQMEVKQAGYFAKVMTETIIKLKEEFGEPGVWDLRGGGSNLIIKNGLARWLRATQVASAPTVFFEDSGNSKLEWLQDYRNSGGRPAVIFTRFTHTRDKVLECLQDNNATGYTVGTYDAMSEGLNLQHYDTIIAWDPAPSRLKWEQARARIDRIGQTKPCHIYRLHTADVDDKSWAALDQKQDLVAAVIEWLRGVKDDFQY